jgi:hypothetical protein
MSPGVPQTVDLNQRSVGEVMGGGHGGVTEGMNILEDKLSRNDLLDLDCIIHQPQLDYQRNIQISN